MTFRLFTLICLLLVGSAAAGSPMCSRVKSNPDIWINARVDALVRGARASYENGDTTDAYLSVLTGIKSTIQRCKLSEDVVFATRYKEFVEYIATASLDLSPKHELGFVVPDQQYFAETRQFTTIPEFLLVPEFLRAVSRFETLDKAKAFLADLNRSRASADRLLFLSYKSRHLGTPDNNESYRRLLIVIPGNAETPEKWIQFAVTDPGERERVRNVSVVSAMPRSDGTFDIYFKDFYRTYRRNGSIRIKGRWELGEGDDNCVQCHKSGVLPIFPAKGSLGEGEGAVLRAVNERFRSYGPPRFDKYLDTSKLGPGLGAVSWQERKARFGAEFEGTRVANSMVCSSCHNTDRMGSFNWPMDKTVISSFIEGGQMPKGFRVSETQRRQLHDKLIEEYFSIDDAQPGILKSWLLGRLG